MHLGYIKAQNTFVPIYNEIGEIVNRNINTIHPSKGIKRIKNTINRQFNIKLKRLRLNRG